VQRKSVGARSPGDARSRRLPPKGGHMVPLLLWILGVPGILILLLLLLGILHL
jgi:hypothetical protein